MQLGRTIKSLFFLFNFYLNYRSDHVIIQSYEEQLDDHRLYVAIFIKDPYRQSIALTNEQFLLALQRNQQEIYHDIKHHV
jgi:hypothetical protein